MLRHAMKQTGYKLTATRNNFGDIEYDGTGTEIQARFREITNIISANQMESIKSDAMAWFAPGEEIAENDIVKFGDDYYKVIKVIYARRMSGGTIQFIKTYLERDKGVIS